MSNSPTSPPSSSSPFLNGNYDYPPASSSPGLTRAPIEGIGALLETIDRETREAQLAAREVAGDFWPDSRPSVQATASRPRTVHRAEAREVRRRPHRRAVPSTRREPTVDDLSRRVRSPPSTHTDRPRANPSERFLRRSRLLREQRSGDMDSQGPADRRGINPFRPPSYLQRRSPPSEPEDQRRQPKRRKIEHEQNTPRPYDGFRYGRYGEVETGRLRMEIASCDGGEYEEASNPGLYKVQNVLANDKSVYCSEISHCNLLLKHIGGTPFTLEKIVIKAPHRGFTAPVQEGMIFVSMSSDELLSKTAGYKIQYDSPSASRTATPDDHEEEFIPLSQAINDPYVWQHSAQYRREEAEMFEHELERLRRRRSVLMRRLDVADREIFRQRDLDNCDWPVPDASDPATAGPSAPTPPPFTVTLESGGESDEEQDQPSAAVMADRLRREIRWREESDDEDEDLADLLQPPRARGFRSPFRSIFGRVVPDRSTGRSGLLRRAPRLIEPSRIEAGTQDGDVLRPHARFFIARHKNKITINFHPAISGRFILLKFWSPVPNGNIDIESVQFHGFSGPRFFPATELR